MASAAAICPVRSSTRRGPRSRLSTRTSVRASTRPSRSSTWWRARSSETARARPSRPSLSERELGLYCFRREHGGQIIHRPVARAERRQSVAVLDGRQDRGRVVLGVVDDKLSAQALRDDQRRDPRTGAPHVVRAGDAALSGRRDVVPLAAEFVVGDDDHGVALAGALVDHLEQLDEVVAAAILACVARVLILEPDWLDEADRVELA